MADARAGEFTYDVALSFAGEQRTYVEKVAAALRRRGIRPFYDDYEKAALWGKDLYEHLDWVYQKAARYCVLFASEAYAKKVWTTHERRSAQARALQSAEEYVLPVRFDDTEVPGLRPTIAHVEAASNTPAQLAKLISESLLVNGFMPLVDLSAAAVPRYVRRPTVGGAVPRYAGGPPAGS